MNLKYGTLAVLAITLLGIPRQSSGLTMSQFTAICASREGQCNEHPLLQAYVGGALDLVAMLDEESDYLAEIYCEEPRKLFDVAAIIQFMVGHAERYADRNAMLLLIRYLEENGRCRTGE